MSGMSNTSTTTLKTDDTSKVLPGDKTGLPLEIWQIIFSYLSVKDLCYVARVSKTWYDLARSIDVTRWKELYLACQEWRHPYWPLHSNLEPSSWKLAYRNQHMSTKFWHRCAQQAHKAGCMTLLKRVRERQTIQVGPGCQHETLKSAFAVASEYDKILVHPGIYDEQLEMSLKTSFELVGVGELGSVILVICLEHVALSGRFSNLVLRAPWFTNFIFKVRSGYMQMDNCIMEDGMMCVTNPGACHIQFCTFRHATVILQHVSASIIRNCEFSQSDNANIVVEGYPKEEKCWAYPHLCQQMDIVFRHKRSPDHPHPLKATESTTSTLHSTHTGKSFNASSARTVDTMSRGRAGSHDADMEGMKTGVNNANSQTNYGAWNKLGMNNVVNSHGGANGLHGSHICAMDSNADRQLNTGHVSTVSVNRVGATSCSNGASADPRSWNGAKMLPAGVSPPQQHCDMYTSEHQAGQHTQQTVLCKNSPGAACCLEHKENKDVDDEWLEIIDERKAWQIDSDDKKDKDVSNQPHPQCIRNEKKIFQNDVPGVKPYEYVGTGVTSCNGQDAGTVCENSQIHERGAHNWLGVEGSSNNDKTATYATADKQGHHCAKNSSHAKQNNEQYKTDSTERCDLLNSKQPNLATTCIVFPSPPQAFHSSEMPKSEGESLTQGMTLHQSAGEGIFNADMFPQNLPPLNSNTARYHYHDPPLLQNPHPHTPRVELQQAGRGAHPEYGVGENSLQGLEQHLPADHVVPGEGEAAERRSQRSFHSSRNGETSSEEDDDLSILDELEAAASSSGGSDRGNNSSSSSEEDSEVEEFYHANSEYDSSDAEESVIMLPHLRQKHLDASVSANAVNADVDSICSQTSPPITLSTSQDEGVLSHVHKVRGCLIHQCRMMHSKGGVMISLQGHALVSGCDISNVSYGIRCIQNARVVVIKNRIHHCQTSGLFMRLAASGLIAGNDIHSNNEAGVDIRKNADPIVQHNRIHHGKRSGVVVLGSGRGQIRNNNIYGNTEAGIYILYGGNPTVSENHIYDGKAAGVAVNEGGQGFIFDNTISSNQWGGVDIRRGSCPMVCGNTITNGLGDGIVIGDQGQGTIENNIIADNAGCGLWLMSVSHPYIHGNQISNNGDTGVMMVNKTDIQQESSHMLPAGGDGVHHMTASLTMMGALLDDLPPPPPKCAHTTLQHNNIYHNAGRGMAVELGEEVEVKYNAIYANHQDGVWVHQEAPVSLHANSISSNHGHGVITALTPSVEIVGNGIYDNHQWGIQCSGRLHISENDIVGNQSGGITVDKDSVCKIQDNRIQTASGPSVRLAEGVNDSVVEANTMFQGDPRAVQNLSQQALVRDNKVVLPVLAGFEKESISVSAAVGAGAFSRHKSTKETGGFNKSLHLRDPPPRPTIQPPPPPSVLPAHNLSTVTKVMVPSGDTCQQGSKLCCIL